MQQLSKEERLEKVIAQVVATGKVDMRSLSELLNVSVDTIRRDIRELDEQGRLKAIRGGAIAHSPVPAPFRERLAYNTGEKQQIALKAISQLQNGQVVLLDSGTSALALATNIPVDLHLTIITNSFPIVNVLENHPHVEVIFAGGRLSRLGFHTVGPETNRVFESVSADICFISVYSIHPAIGVTSKEYEDALLKKTLIGHARKVVALATANKTDTAEAFLICPPEKLDVLITDINPADGDLQVYQALGIQVI